MALTVTLTDVPGMLSPRQKVGQFVDVYKDVLVTSDGDNSAGAITITAAQLGLTRLYGGLMLSADPLDISTPEPATQAQFNVPAGGANVLVTPRRVDGAAVDLDTGESYSIRLVFRGQ